MKHYLYIVNSKTYTSLQSICNRFDIETCNLMVINKLETYIAVSRDDNNTKQILLIAKIVLGDT